mgnify:CR=1 FL=1
MSSRLPLLLFSLLPLTLPARAQDPVPPDQAGPAVETGAQPGTAAPLAPVGSVRPKKDYSKGYPAPWRPGFESIRVEDCRAWLTHLASDEMEGRATGQPGFERAARWLAARFQEFGLEPVAADGSYFQMVPFEATQVSVDKSYLALIEKPKDGDDAATRPKELLRLPIGKGLGGSMYEPSTKRHDLIFVTARTATDIDRDKVSRKTVIFVDRSEIGPYGRSKAYVALRRARPAAVILVDEKRANADVLANRRVRYAGRKNALGGRWRQPNQYALTPEATARLLAHAGIQVDLGKDAAAGTWVLDGVQLQSHIEVETKPVFACNVVGMLRGRDPELSKEIVGIGSHLDHIGKRGTVVNNGADDDGSGTTGVLAVARAFTQNKHRPRRSLLFMAFCGEELGLIGSSYYVDHPLFPNSQMVAELQMDMIGRNEEHTRSGEKAEDNVNSLHLVGSKKLSEELHEICLHANDRFAGFAFEYDEENVFNRSDHKNFAKMDIPIAFFFTGFHPQYHKPDDTVDRIDFPKLARVARLVYSIAWETAERDRRPKVDRTYAEVMEAERAKRAAERAGRQRRR